MSAPTLTTEEQATLDHGDVVIRSDEDEAGATVVTGIIHTKASPDRALDAVIDLPPRVDEVGPISKVTYYEQTPSQEAAEFVLSILGTTTTFHVIYDIDRANYLAKYHLDTSQPNDVASLAGSYEAVPVADGCLIVYHGTIEAGGYVPGWVKERFTRGSLVEQLDGMRTRAEAVR